MDTNKICSQILLGKISETKNSTNITDTKASISILVALCKYLSENDSELVTDIFYITNNCCNNLSALSESQKENFLRSMYHIIKYFCLRKSHCYVLKLVECVSSINKTYKSDFYTYFINLFHNHIFRNASSLDGDFLHKIIIYAIDFNLLLKTVIPGSLFSKIETYSTLFRHPKLTDTHFINFCSRVFEIFDNLSVNIGEIYETLLKILNVNICILSLCEENNFPNFIKHNFKMICQIMKKNCNKKEYQDCIEILESLSQALVKDLKERNETDLNNLIECNKKFRIVIRKYHFHPVIVKTFTEIAKIFRKIFEYYQTCMNLWNDFFPISMQVEILKMIEILGQYLSQNKTNLEKCCGICKIKTDINNAALITSCSGIFVINSLRSNLSCTPEFYDLSLLCLTDCCKFITKLKEGKCDKYINIWQIIGTGIYNIAVILYRNKDYKRSKDYANLFISNILENQIDSDDCLMESLGAALNLYGLCCSILDEKKECLLYLCLTMLLSVKYKKIALQTWIKIKMKDADNEEGIKSTNIYHILFNQQSEIKKIYPAYEYNEKTCKALLMEELLFYNENWRSRIPMSSVCDDFCKISKDPTKRTIIFAICWDKVYYSNLNFVEYIEHTIEIIGTTSEVNLNTCLSVLYFILYQCKIYEIGEKNLADINEAYIPLKRVQPYEEPINPNDKCDIVPDYYNMKIDNLLPIFQILDNALEIWEKLLHVDKIILDADLIRAVNLGGMIKYTAREYRQQLFNIKMLKTWILYYKLSKHFHNSLEAITAIGFIIEYSDCESKIIKSLEKEAEKLLTDFDMNDSNELDIYLTYYINKSTGYLRNDLVKEGYAALVKAEEFLTKAQEKDLRICEARILNLKTRYLMMPCAYKILSHKENFLVTSSNSYVAIGEFYSKSPKCPYLTSILLEIALFNGWMYKWLRLPREVRCYCKESILLSQKNCLSLRTAQFLSLLAFTDLLDLQYSDCEVKLNGLTNLLSYSKISYKKSEFETGKDDLKLEASDSDLSEMNQSFSGIQIVLEAPASQRSNQDIFMSSPDLRKKPFSLPELMTHPENCNCFVCSNCDYQKLVSDSIHIEALLNFYQNIDGQEYFKGGLAVHKKLFEKSQLDFYKSLKFTDENILISVYKNVAQNYCTFLLDYSYFLLRNNNLTEANKTVDYIFKILKTRKCVNSYLWDELIMQKINLTDTEEENMKYKITPNELQFPVVVNNSTTPKDGVSKANIRLSVSPINVPKPVKTFKKLKFDLSEDEKEDNLPVTPDLNKNIFFKSRTPAKTPAASKIKIYSPKTVKSKRTTRTTATSVKKTGNNKQNEDRMKLLTEKLKSENKQQIEKENFAPKNSIQKKLFNDITDLTESLTKLSTTEKTNKNETHKQSVATRSNKLKETQKTDSVTTKLKTVERKKYSRIKMLSTSSSSSEASTGSRRSTRNRKT